MHVLVTYDVATTTKAGRKRLRSVAKACESYGQRVQYSVFECTLREVDLYRLRERLLRIMDRTEDSVRIYRIRKDDDGVVEHYGRGDVVDFRGPLVL